MAKQSAAAAPPPAPAAPAAPSAAPMRATGEAQPDGSKETPSPSREVSQRLASVIEKHTGKADRAEVERAKESAPKAEKEPRAAAAEGADSPAASSKPSTAEPPSKEPKKPSEEAQSTPEAKPSEAKAEPAPDAESGKRGPRYDVKSFRKWAEENPEQAAEIGEQVYSVGGDIKSEWIKVQNKKRKVRDELRSERAAWETERSEKDKKADARIANAEKAIELLQPIRDLFAANYEHMQKTGKPDFDACDAAFQRSTGMKFDDYARMRARSGVRSPEAAEQRATIQRLQRELAEAKAPKERESSPAGDAEGAAKGAGEAKVPPPSAKAPPAPEAPKSETKSEWESDIPKGHKLRQIVGWQEKLAGEMAKYHDPDLDDYSADPEDIADRVLKRELAALSGTESDDDDVPEKRERPKRKAPKSPPKETKVEDLGKEEEELSANFSTRMQQAIERAMKRGREQGYT